MKDTDSVFLVLQKTSVRVFERSQYQLYVYKTLRRLAESLHRADRERRITHRRQVSRRSYWRGHLSYRKAFVVSPPPDNHEGDNEMRNRVFALTSIVALIIGATVFVLGNNDGVLAHFQYRADGPPHRFGPEMVDHIARELNLTDGQKAQIKTLLETANNTMAPLQQKLEDVRSQLELATANGQFDEAQVRALATQQAQLMADTIVEHERLKSKIYSLLTPEQRAKAEEMHKRHSDHLRNSEGGLRSHP
jgi:periplasmic protein CpxP/Spy